MALGYHRRLFILTLDHRGSFQRKMLAIADDPTPEQALWAARGAHVQRASLDAGHDLNSRN